MIGEGFKGCAPFSGIAFPLENSEQLQGLWRSDVGSELTLAPSRGGTLVGLYRLTQESAGGQQVAGHVQDGCVVFSAPLLQEPGVVGWMGSVQLDREGPRLDLDRVVVRSGGGPEAAVAETFRRVRSGADQTRPLELHRRPGPSIQGKKKA